MWVGPEAPCAPSPQADPQFGVEMPTPACLASPKSEDCEAGESDVP